MAELEKAIRDSGFLVSGLRETGRTLGKGSYGEVIEVRVNGRLCAAKKLHGIFNAQDVPPAEKASMAKRFERECRRVLQLKHPNIVEMIGVHFDRTTQQPTLVMELLDTSLCSYLEKNPVASVTTATKYSILLDVATGLVYLHTLPPPLGPIVHRDLTASNILLALGGKIVAKIADLGQAKNDPAYTAQRHKLSQVPGNEDHMPPEAWLDEPTYNTSLDIFSFGVVMLHTLVHKWPKPLAKMASFTRVRSEVERRKSYLDQIDGSLLKPLVIECLGQKPEERPVASAVLGTLKMGKHCVSKMASLREAHRTETATLNQRTHSLQIQVNQLQAAAATAAAEGERRVHSLQQEVNLFRVAAVQDKERIKLLQQKVDQLQSAAAGGNSHRDPSLSTGLGIGSPVQLGDPSRRTGVIRWIGTLPEIKGCVAGVELDGPMEGCGDGVWRRRRYFTCLPGRSFFCPITSVLPDPRVPQASQVGGASTGNPLQAPEWEDEDQLIYAGQIQKYLGDGRGIQGHQNSCYIDATIFGLFALSDVFDLCFMESSPMSLKGSQLSSADARVQREISHMLWRGIVNPLRKNGAVPYESVMKLRNRLDDLGKMEGVYTAEKDPEEFLNMLFKHALYVEPFIKIKRPFGTEPEFFVQLFVEYDESLKVPTIQTLLEMMFKEQQISFDGVPSKLLVQVPRYGKQFQTYRRIIPGVKLDPTTLIDCPYTCFICKEKAWITCYKCKSEFATSDGRVYFCNDCNDKVHRHKSRTSHKPEKCRELEDVLELELLSVLCIETSHYVCFTRDAEGRWLFFDSMASRVHDQYNIPRGVDCTDQLNDWVYKGSPERLMATGSRDLPELVRRFTQDVYMCVYILPDYGMYG